MERVRLEHGVLRLDVRGHRGPAIFLDPFDRARVAPLRDRPRVVGRHHALARAAGLIARRPAFHLPLTLVESSIDLLPYQVEPLLAWLAGRRRLMIADEVGLGKTIEAGLVIAELARREIAIRVLVLVPAALRAQWRDELSRRFGVSAEMADATAFGERTGTGVVGANPWAGAGVWLSSVDYVKQPHVLASLPAMPWDLVVIDEAHDVCGDSERHEACAAIAESARCLLLLTATPHSGDEARFHRLTNLGALTEQGDELVIFRRTRETAGLAPRSRLRWNRVRLTPGHRRALDALARFERALIHGAPGARPDAVALLLSVFRKRALSTLGALAASVSRRLAVLDARGHLHTDSWTQPPLPLGEEDEIADDERAALAVVIGVAEAYERSCLRRLERTALVAAGSDAKLRWLRRVLMRAHEPVVIFTEFRQSLHAIERHLNGARSSAVLHGGQSSSERASSLERFVTGRASALIATDVAGQGLNLQHAARWVISFEMPWNPIRLEQRVGRVDRIGQANRVHATILLADHDAERPLISRFARRLRMARQSLGRGALSSMSPPIDLDSESEDHVAVGRAEPDPLVGALTPAGAWCRSAHAVVRLVSRRRALRSAWRTPAAESARPWTTRTTPSATDRQWLFLVSIPLLDGAGAEIERLAFLFATRLEAATVLALHRARRLDTLWQRRVDARMRRLTRLSRARADLQCATERALASRWQAAHGSRPMSPSLFDRHAVREFERERRNAGTRLADMNRWIATAQDRARLSMGEPRIDLVIQIRA